MAIQPVQRPTFFELFRTRCRNTEVGPTSLNWFEELTAEATPCEPKNSEKLDSKNDWFDKNTFKTPRHRVAAYSQLASTPIIFKEDALRSPTFSSPVKERAQCTSLVQKPGVVTNEWSKSPHSNQMKPDLSKEVLSSPRSTALHESPAIVREMFRTPRRIMKCTHQTPLREQNEVCGSLFCTPKLLRDQTAKCISESLGVEVDPEMSWSSSLATPPTLTATVIIAKGNDQLSGPQHLEDSTDIIVHRLLTKCNKSDGKHATPTLCHSVKERITFEHDAKFQADIKQNMATSLEDTQGCENKMPVITTSVLKQTVPNALKEREVRQTVENVLDGMEDVLSVFFTSGKPLGLKKVKTVDGVRRKQIEKSGSVVGDTGELAGCINSDICLHRMGTHFDSSTCSVSVKNKSTVRKHDETISDKPTQEDIPCSSASQWSKLSLSGLNVTQLESMSFCVPSSSVDLLSVKYVEETFSDAKECTVTSDLEVSSEVDSLPQVKRELNFNVTENVKNNTNIPELQTIVHICKASIHDLSPPDDLYERSPSPTFPKSQTPRPNSSIKTIESTNFCLQNKSLGKDTGVLESSFHGDLAGNCITIKCDQCADSVHFPCIDSPSRETEPQMKSKGILSRLKKQPKKFIYSIPDISLQKEQKIIANLSPESSICALLTSEQKTFSPNGDDEGAKTSRFDACSEKKICRKNCIETNEINDIFFKNNDEIQREINFEKATSLQTAAMLGLSPISEQKQSMKMTNRNVSSIKRKVVAAAALLAAKRSRIEPINGDNTVELAKNPNLVSGCSKDSEFDCPKDHFEESFSVEMCCDSVELLNTVENCDSNIMPIQDSKDEETACQIVSAKENCISDLALKQLMMASGTNCALGHLPWPTQKAECGSAQPEKKKDTCLNLHSLGVVQQPECITAGEASNSASFQTASKKTIAIEKVQKLFDNTKCSCSNEVISPAPPMSKLDLKEKQEQTVFDLIPNSVPTCVFQNVPSVAGFGQCKNITKSPFPSTERLEEVDRSTDSFSNPDIEIRQLGGTDLKETPVHFASEFKVSVGDFKTASDRSIQISMNNATKGKRLFKEIEEQFCTEKEENLNSLGNSLFLSVCNKMSTDLPSVEFKTVLDNQLKISKNRLKKGRQLSKEFENCSTGVGCENVDITADTNILPDSPSVLNLHAERFITDSTKQPGISENILKGNILFQEIGEHNIANKLNENKDIKPDVKVLSACGENVHLSEYHIHTGSENGNENNLGESHPLPDFNTSVLNDHINEFQTASEKKIHISENNIKKGKMTFQEIKEHCHSRKVHTDDTIHDPLILPVINELGPNETLITSESATKIQIPVTQKEFDRSRMHVRESKTCFSTGRRNVSFGGFETVCHQLQHDSGNKLKKDKNLVKQIEEHCLNGKISTNDGEMVFIGSSSNVLSCFSKTESIIKSQRCGQLTNKHILFNKTENQFIAEECKNADFVKTLNMFPVLSETSKNVPVCGFKTASNKWIQLSENQVEKGKMIFKELEGNFQNTLGQHVEENISVLSMQQTLAAAPPRESTIKESCVLGIMEPKGLALINTESFCDTRQIIQNFPTKPLSQPSQSLTESQKAEITELSHMLEENYSQFEFTQLKKTSNAITSDTKALSMTPCEITQLNNSDMWKDVDFNDSFDTEVQLADTIQPSGMPNLNKSSVVTHHFKNEAVDLEYKTFENPEVNVADESVLAPLHAVPKDSLTGSESFRLATDTKIDFDHDIRLSPGNLSRDTLGTGEEIEYLETNVKKHVHTRTVKATFGFQPENHCDTCTSKRKSYGWIKLNQNISKPNMNNCERIITEDEHKHSSISSGFVSSIDKAICVRDNEHIDKNIRQSENGVSSTGERHNYDLQQGISQHSAQLKRVATFENGNTFNCYSDGSWSHELLDKEENKNTNYVPGGFQTAAGRNILVSKKSLDKAHILFQEDSSSPLLVGEPLIENVIHSRDSDLIKSTAGLQNTVVQETEFSDFKNTVLTIDPCTYNIKRPEGSMNGIHTASGKKIIVTGASLANIKHICLEETLQVDVKHEVTATLNKMEKSNPLVTINEILEGSLPEKYCSDTTFKCNGSRQQPVYVKYVSTLEQNNEDPNKEPSQRDIYETNSLNVEVSNLLHSGSENSDIHRLGKSPMSLSESSLGFCTGQGKAIHLSESAIQTGKDLFVKSDFAGIAQNNVPKNVFSLNKCVTVPKGQDVLVEDPTHTTALNTKDYDFSKIVNVGEITENQDSKQIYGLNNCDDSNSNAYGVKAECSTILQEQETIIIGKESHINAEDTCQTILRFDENIKNNSLDSPVLRSDDSYSEINVKGRQSIINSGESKIQHLKGITFTTAAGKKVSVSDESLMKAKQLFQEVCKSDEFILPKINSMSLVNQAEVPVPCSQAAADAAQSITFSNNLPSEDKCTRKSNECPFSVNKGKEICVQKNALKHVSMTFVDMDTENTLQPYKYGFQLVDNYVSNCYDKFTSKVDSGPSDNTLEITGPFSTASGKPVQLSEKSLKKAKQLFLEIESSSPVNDKDMLILKPSCKEEKTMYAEKDSVVNINSMPVEEKYSRSSIGCPFSTVKGKQVCVQEKSLKHVRRTFADMRTESTLQTFGGQATDSYVSKFQDKSTYKVDTTLEKTGFFSTASGKPVQLSEESLKKAKQLFLEIESSSPAYDKCEFNLKLPRKEDDDKPVHARKDNMFNTNPPPIEEKHTRSSIEFPFSTAKGKQVGVLEKSLKHVKRTFSDMETENSVQSCGFSVADNCVVKCQDKSTCVGNFAGGFNTASGIAVQFSEDSLRKARQLFMEIETGNNNSKPDNKDICTMKYQCKEDGTMFGKKDIMFDTNVEQTTPHDSTVSKNLVHLKANCGFNTASGKQVLVSEGTLEKVKNMLKEFDDLCSIEYDSLSEQPQPGPLKKTYMCGLPQLGEVLVKKRSAGPLQKTQVEKSMQNSSKTVYYSEMPESFLQSEERAPTALEHNLPPYNKSTVHSRPHCKAETTAENRNSPFASFVRAPENYQEKEAMESAIALMDDGDLTENSMIYAGETCPSTEEEKKQNRKRLRTEEGSLFGAPPIKRQLLPEFDRTVETNRSSAFKAMMSTPDDASRDRQKFLYNVALKPISCRPPSGKKGRKEVKIPSFTVPDQDLKGFHCRTTIFQNRLLNFPENDPSVASSPCRMTPVQEFEKPKSMQAPSKQVKTFIPPFKTKTTFPSGDANSDISSKENVSTGDEKVKYQNEETVDSDVSVKTTIALEDSQFNEQGRREMIENLHCARDMQAMRIRKKQRQKILPQPGSLYMAKTSTSGRISLKAAVEGKCPYSYSLEQLHMFGVLENSIRINSANAESFQFDCLDHFSKDLLFAGHGIQIADGGWLIPTDNHKAGKEELYRALCDTPGVDPKLISEAWANNHYRWIVWKLAAMEVSFPEKFASCCLTPERVLLQLKYRYDVEVDKSQRSALKKIMERDDTAAKTLILCFSQVISMGTSLLSPNGSKPNVTDANKGITVIEVTDGWYGIKALLDPPLSALVNRKRLAVGSKIIVHGAELIGSDEACTPLEAPESLMLKISANSTRLARWYAVLGFYQDPKPFPLSLSSLFSDGGLVGCIDVIIQRVYPLQWMEKMPNGMYVFRNDRAEEREAEKHSVKQQKNLEALFAKIQAAFEQSEAKAKSEVSRRTLTRKQIHAMQDGADLYEAIQNESDPGYLEACLSNEQLKALNNHRQTLNDRKQAEIQAEFRKAIESDEQGQNGCGKRDVTAIWKVRIVDYKNQEKDAAFILNIWRPLSDVRSLLKEGGRYRMYHLSTSHSKGKSDTRDVQLTATKKTQYQQLQPSQEILASIFSPRRAVQFSELLGPSFCAPCAEVDVVGYVISISRKAGLPPYAYLSDENHNLIAIKIWTDLCQLALEDVIKPYTLIAASNLQLRSNCDLSIPTLFAGELSLISANPKDGYLQEKISKLRNTVQNIKIFCNDAEKKLVNLLQTSRQDGLKSTQYSLDPDGPAWKSGVGANKKILTTSDDKTQLRASLSMFTPGRTLSETAVSASITPRVSCRDKKELDSSKDSKKKKALHFLCRIPSPPPVSPGQAMVSPSLQKAFRPPRSSGPPYSSIIRDKNCKSTGARSLQKCNTTTSKPEEGWVADEELAMINTQALLCGIDEEKKMCFLGENSNDLSCGAEIKKDCQQSVIGISTDPVINMRQKAEGNEKKLSITQPISYQRKLKRRKRKCY